MADQVGIVEVGMRDGFQSIARIIPLETKLKTLHDLYNAGVRRLEVTSFVSPSAVPQLADAAEVLRAAQALPGLDAQVLTTTARHAQRALEAGADHVAFVVSVSERHNQSNVRRTPAESLQEYARVVAMLPNGVRLRLNLATAFDCPYEGRVDEAAVLSLLDDSALVAPEAEIALCDTTGRAAPQQVERLFAAAQARFPHARWAFHGHDTYGMGAANVFAAWKAGVRVIDASVAGLGGCPFAPGATGNVATEDLVWMFDAMGVTSGINLKALIAVGRDIAAWPDAQTGGRVREALNAAARKALGGVS